MAYLEELLRAHRALARWYAGEEARTALPEAEPELSRESPAFFRRAAQAHSEILAAGTESESLLSQAQRAFSVEPARETVRRRRGDDRAERRGNLAQEGWEEPRRSVPSRTQRGAGETDGMEAISRFFERDARRYG